MRKSNAIALLLLLQPFLGMCQSQKWDSGDAERRSVKISVTLPAAIARVPVTFEVNGIILRENRVLMFAVAALPGATISIDGKPVEIAGWVPQNFAAIAHASIGKGMTLPLIRGAVAGEKVTYIGYDAKGQLIVLNGTVVEVIARGDSRIAFIDVFPVNGMGFGVWSQEDGALVAVHVAMSEREGMALSLQMLPERLENLKPLGIGRQRPD